MQTTYKRRVYDLIEADTLPARQMILMRNGYDGTQWYGTPAGGSKFFAKVMLFVRTKAGKFVPAGN